MRNLPTQTELIESMIRNTEHLALHLKNLLDKKSEFSLELAKMTIGLLYEDAKYLQKPLDS